ncbi:hypothetical protein [Bacillus phage vB_BanS-Thrax5]|nr:hypothetical protein [Bacillus phage vB_BanS-Thrax5]
MGFLVIDKNTGEVVFDKIYTTAGRAQSIIDAGLRRGNVKGGQDLVVIPMPSKGVLKEIAEGAKYTTITYSGKIQTRTDWE